MTQQQLDQMAESKYPMPGKWTEPDAGTIHVPDELDSLINQVGFQYRLHTISKRFGEAEFICRAVYACQKYFIDKQRSAYIEGIKLMEERVRELEGALKSIIGELAMQNEYQAKAIAQTALSNQPKPGAKEGE